MRVVFEPHTSNKCAYKDCLVLVDGVPYKVTYCTICGRIRSIAYTNGDYNGFINKHKELEIFTL